MIRIAYVSVLLIHITVLVYSQEGHSDEDFPDFESIIEDLFPIQEEDFNYADIYDRLFSIYRNPIDINHCNREELEELYFLNNIQIQSILDYRGQYGKILSIYELSAIKSLQESSVKMLAHFVTVKHINREVNFARKFRQPNKHDFLFRYDQVLEKSSGYTDPDSTKRFLGNPSRLFGRYSLVSDGDYHIGFAFEKDPGEEIRWNPGTNQYGMDYFTWHVMLENRGIIKKLVLGNFSLNLGQGLVSGAGLRMGKGFEAISTIRRKSTGIKPYRSIYEHRDFSGAAVQIGSDKFHLTGFWSLARRDALPREDTVLQEEPYVTYIKKTGLHRNKQELSSKHQIRDNTFGLNAEASLLKNHFRVGMNLMETRFNLNLMPTSRIYNSYDFDGDINRIASLYGNIVWKHINIFGEGAVSHSGGRGALAGIVTSLSSYLHFSFLWRDYERNFHTLYSKAFGEDGQNNNEKGYYFGLKIIPGRRVVVNFFYDRFRFPWLRYAADAPSEGHELVGVVSYEASKKLKLRGVYRQKMIEKNWRESGNPTSQLQDEVKQTFRIESDWVYSSNLLLKTRIQASKYRFVGTLSNGFILAQDIIYTNRNLKLSVRGAYFKTDDYSSRIYIYERDLPLVYNIPSFYGRGIRYYFIAGLKWSRSFSSWFKISQTNYLDRSQIGSGLDEISGNLKTRIKIQFMVHF
jgi:hypothetical protein